MCLTFPAGCSPNRPRHSTGARSPGRFTHEAPGLRVFSLTRTSAYRSPTRRRPPKPHRGRDRGCQAVLTPATTRAVSEAAQACTLGRPAMAWYAPLTGMPVGQKAEPERVRGLDIGLKTGRARRRLRRAWRTTPERLSTPGSCGAFTGCRAAPTDYCSPGLSLSPSRSGSPGSTSWSFPPTAPLARLLWWLARADPF